MATPEETNPLETVELELPDELYEQVKAAAEREGITFEEYVHRALLDMIRELESQKES